VQGAGLWRQSHGMLQLRLSYVLAVSARVPHRALDWAVGLLA
jgi:hypothetical protein